MSAIDTSLQRLADGVARLSEITKDLSDNADKDQRELREKLDELMRAMAEHKLALVELRHQLGDDMAGVIDTALGSQEVRLKSHIGEASKETRHAMREMFQPLYNQRAIERYRHAGAEPAGGESEREPTGEVRAEKPEKKEEYALIDKEGIHLTWAGVKRVMPWVIAAGSSLGTAWTAVQHYLLHK